MTRPLAFVPHYMMYVKISFSIKFRLTGGNFLSRIKLKL
jgi:hypothetical protein